MRAQEVLECQAELLDRLRSSAFRTVIAQTLAMAGAVPAARAPGVTAEAYIQGAAAQATNLLPSVRRAAAYYVTEDMSLLVEHAASGLDDTDIVDHTLAPTPCGIVRLDRPLQLTTVRGQIMKCHWLVWGSPIPTPQGDTSTIVFAFNDHTEPDETGRDLMAKYGADHMRAITGRWGLRRGDVYRDGRPMGPAHEEPNPDYAALVLADGDTPTPCTTTLRFLHALWLMLGQTVVAREAARVDPAFATRAERRGLVPEVTVITLRRRSEAARTAGESLVEWSRRWVVRGHWRNQPIGEGHRLVLAGKARWIDGKWTYRKWLVATIKGPEDKPLIVNDKVVYKLSR